MFIALKYSGYNRHGEQSAAGPFLILMQPNTDSQKYHPWRSDRCSGCGLTRDEHPTISIPGCSKHGVVARLRRLSQIEREAVDEVHAIWNEKFDPECPECQRREEALKQCQVFAAKANTHPLRAIVRYVRMRQLGHFMMGSARIGKTSITLSGSYGHDGLPVSVPDEVYEAGTELPQELYDAWNNGGGWNSAGSEAEAMRKWAKQNLITARKK